MELSAKKTCVLCNSTKFEIGPAKIKPEGCMPTTYDLAFECANCKTVQVVDEDGLIHVLSVDPNIIHLIRKFITDKIVLYGDKSCE